MTEFTKCSDGIGIAKENLAEATMKKIIFSAVVIGSGLAFTTAAVYAGPG
jgi:hypothetical protein